MTTAERLRAKLMNKLKELFQLSQPDLDFGFYRIMNTKAEEIANFIDHDLLQEISDAFQLVDEAQRKKLQDAVDAEIKNAKEYGVQDPENSPKVLEAKEKLNAAKDTATTEADIYDHLYRFFERYYDNGDFISRRYYTRETPGKAAPFAIPYNGEEVKLHWAN
ncbi:MAG: site-specific DNA-methyltransferase, partial [Candidatus Cloacimonetes bacterium]|nr:site-specific DNA-methyltransferase [Candidatus Cloacimonadota bacterium]